MSSQSQFDVSTEVPNENEPTNEENTNNTLQGTSEPSNSAEFDSQNTTNEPEEENRTQLNEPPTYGQPLRQYHTWNPPIMYPPTVIYYNPYGNCQMPGYSPCVHCVRNRVSMNPIIYGHVPFSFGQLSTTVAQAPQHQQIGVYQQVPVQGVQVEGRHQVSGHNQVPVQYQMPVHQQMAENNQAPVPQQAAEQNQAPEHSQVPVLHQAAEQNQAPERNQVGVQNQVLENSQARVQTQIAVRSQSPVHNQEPENSQVRIHHQVPVNSGIPPQTQTIKIIVEPSGVSCRTEPKEAAKMRSKPGDAVEKNKERETEERNQNDFEPIMIKIHFEQEEDIDSNKNKKAEEMLSNTRKENEKNKGPMESVGEIKEEPLEESSQEIVNIFDSREREEPAKKSRKLNEGRKCDNVTGDSARANLQRPSSTRATQTEFRNEPANQPRHGNTPTDKPGPSKARATQTEPRDPPTNQPGPSSARATQTDPRDARATQTDFSNTPENQPGPSNAPGNQTGGSNGSMAGGGRNLTETLKPYQRKEIRKWSVLDVYDFIKDIPGCEDCAKTFFIHEIDGEVLVLLTIDTMMTEMSIKLGNAVKLVAKIQSMKTETEDDSD